MTKTHRHIHTHSREQHMGIEYLSDCEAAAAAIIDLSKQSCPMNFLEVLLYFFTLIEFNSIF